MLPESSKAQILKNQNYFQIQNQLNLNPHYCHNSIYTGNLLQANKIQKQLYFSFIIKPLQSIRLSSQNHKPILVLTLGDLKLSIKALKNSEQFNYDQGLYRNYLSAELTFGEQPALEVGKKEIKIQQWNSLLITIQKTIQFDDKNKWALQDCIPTLEIGSIKSKKVFECKIKTISLSIEKDSQKLALPKNIYKKALFDGPLDTIPKTQIPDLKSLPSYKSPEPKPGRLYLCHDMEGGYKQDMNKHQPFPQQQNRYKMGQNYSHTYRCLHLAQTDIFNYFSHHLVSIPPKHWRRQCRAARTRCLGTFIVEKQSPTEQEYLSDYTIKMLVYFCKKYQFDGYLLNFQYAIKNAIKLLLPWLRKLVDQLHAAVPGSQIIWYDSVIRNGKVSYQNQINQHNQIFYKTCDGMFLNYWWNEQKLTNTLSHKIENKIIYVGSDCFGRGTFAGGKFDTYKAVNAIKKINDQHNVLAPALFAMGYTYQTQKNNIEAWKLQQKFLYRGMSYSKFMVPHTNWQYHNNTVNGFKWQIDNQWAITSFQPCKRYFSAKIKNLLKDESVGSAMIHFFTTVAGTGPKFQDFYKITMIVSLAQVPMLECSTNKQEASQVEKIVQLKLALDAQLITQQTVVSIIEEGHDVEKWGGNFGTRFKNDQLYVTKYSKQNDWVARIKTNYTNGVQLPFLSYYNLGHGHFFYSKGERIKKSYDFMSDLDINFAYLMNPPMHVSIHYDEAFMGGTCLLVERYSKLKVVEVDLSKKQNLKKTKNICCRVTVKNLQDKVKFGLICKLGSEQNNAKLQKQNQLQNGWIQYHFSIDALSIKPEVEKMIVYIQSGDENCKYLLGQTAIYEDTFAIPKNSIKSLQLIVSEHNPPIAPIFFDACIKMIYNCRIMFVFGEEFACFGYADQLNDLQISIRNIHNRMHAKNNTIKVYTLNDKLEFVEIYKQTVDSKKLVREQTVKLI